jgi:hypothetical protein
MELTTDDFTKVDPPKPKPKPKPEPAKEPAKEPPKCTIEEAISELLSKEEMESCLAWIRSNSYKSFLAHVRPVEHAMDLAKHIIHLWKRSCESRAKWGHIEIPTLSSDPLTVGQLHAHLSEILAAHPDFGTVPVHHEECCGNVETGWVEFLVEEGILVLS